jgi:hypothetical protein
MIIFKMHIGLSRWLAAFAVFISQMACVKPAPRVKVYRLGEKVQVGQLIYHVFETKWLKQIGEGLQARTPSNRFLIIHLTVVNSGAQTVPVQPFTMTDESGRIYSESMEGQDVGNWLGMIRNLKPADTLEGNVVFDVGPTSYKLKLDDGSESGDVLLVELPLQFDSQKPTIPDPVNTFAK